MYPNKTARRMITRRQPAGVRGNAADGRDARDARRKLIGGAMAA